MVTSYSHIVGEKNLLWAEVAELYLGRHEQGANHHEGEHVEAHVVVALSLVQVAPGDQHGGDEHGDGDEHVGDDDYDDEHDCRSGCLLPMNELL